MHALFDLPPDEWAALRRLLDEALDVPAAKRAAWLDRLDARHAALVPRLRALLAHAATPDPDERLLTLPKLDTGPLLAGAGLAAGDLVGPYRLLHPVGEGGMAAVWLAERTDLLQGRRVALKLPHGAWRREGLAQRLEREREILCTLAHPNIARLYDAGVAADGQPYLALEYVQGERIDTHAERRRLDVPARLRLYLQVARAVAHAHANLVVHRDLKPSNILVTDAGEVRLLDFGIAKLLEHGVAAESELTQLSGRALTPDYAAPEQILGQPIGTAADVYALGVVLFELLTQRRPYRLDRASRAALEEAVLNLDPPRPSSVVEDARQRKALRGDLDTIVLKALKKDPTQRYGTVDALAEDIERHLGRRPVLAQPDSAWYRLRKFMLRHGLAVGAAGLVAVAILAGAGVAVWQARVALGEKQRAEDVKEFIASIFRGADPYARIGQVQSARELLLSARAGIEREFGDRPELQVELLNLVGDSLKNLGDLAAAEAALQQAVAQAQRSFGGADPRTLEARVLLAEVHGVQARNDLAAEALSALQPLVQQVATTHPQLLVRVLDNRAHLAFNQGRFEAMEASARAAFALARDALGPHHPQTLRAALVLAESFLMGDRPASARLAESQRALALVLAAHAGRDEHPHVLRARDVHGRALAIAGEFHRAIEQLQLAHDGAQRLLGPGHLATGEAANNLAPYLRRIGDVQGALAHSDRALAVLRLHLDPDSADLASGLTTRGVSLVAARRPAEALRDFEPAEAALLQRFGAAHWETLTVRYNRALALAYLGRIDDAQAALAIGRDLAIRHESPMWMRHVEGAVARLGGRPAAAVAAQTAALAAIGPGPKADWDRMRVLFELGLAQLDDGQAAVAEQSLVAALELFARLKAVPHPAQAEALVALGRIYLARRAPARALPLLSDADAFWRTVDAGNPAGGDAAAWLGRCLGALGRTADAAAARARAKQLARPRAFGAKTSTLDQPGRGGANAGV